MSFKNTSIDSANFERFFYDQFSFRNDFFEEPNPKIMFAVNHSKKKELSDGFQIKRLEKIRFYLSIGQMLLISK